MADGVERMNHSLTPNTKFVNYEEDDYHNLASCAIRDINAGE
jgi:SET domain-containing protein